MENKVCNEKYVDIKKIQNNTEQSINKSKEAVMLLLRAGELLEDAGLISASKDSLFLAKSIATFINDLENDLKINEEDIKNSISEKDYEATLSLIKAMDIDNE